MKEYKTALLMLVAFTVVCGGIYPALVTGLAQALFQSEAQGSLVSDHGGRVIGSRLIGQPFSAEQYFWPRPSATAGFGYNPAASGGSNSGPTNPAYLQTVGDRVEYLRESGVAGSVPAELVQASASGLDPHLSPEAARLQIPRVAKARGMSEAALDRLVAARVEGRQLGLLGVPRLNVLELNLALDGAISEPR